MFKRFLPVLDWGRPYDRNALSGDLIAAVVVAVMLIPQAMAYAMLAGLPPQAGLYGSMVPLLLYALLGSSRTLAVGPVAVVSLLTAAAAGEVAAQGEPAYHLAALALALMSGAALLALGVLRLGFLANFLSHPVISGFITGAGVLIAGSQLRHVLGIDARGSTLPELFGSIARSLGDIHLPTLLLSLGVLAFLFAARRWMAPTLRRLGVGERPADLIAKGSLLFAVVGSTLAVWIFGLAQAGVAVVGEIPRGLPGLSIPSLDASMLVPLIAPAALIAIVGYVESISIAQTLAARRRQRVDPNQELVALGAANLGASVTSAMPVTGGLSRSIVNFDAGARTPAAGAITALLVALTLLLLTPLLFYLPAATLAAIIIVAVASLLDVRAIPRAWSYSRADGAAMIATLLVTLFVGVEQGLMAGVGLSLLMHLYRTSRPHIAIVGQVPGTEHFRNVHRHEVAADPKVLSIRVDESLYFPNARVLEDRINAEVAARPEIEHVVLMCSAVNTIDASALESLEAINARLEGAGLAFHLSEIKGPVMDRLKKTHFLEELSGRVFLTQFDAMRELSPELTDATLSTPRG
jgi:sulfate permease, SulP family